MFPLSNIQFYTTKCLKCCQPTLSWLSSVHILVVTASADLWLNLIKNPPLALWAECVVQMCRCLIKGNVHHPSDCCRAYFIKSLHKSNQCLKMWRAADFTASCFPCKTTCSCQHTNMNLPWWRSEMSIEKSEFYESDDFYTWVCSIYLVSQLNLVQVFHLLICSQIGAA